VYSEYRKKKHAREERRKRKKDKTTAKGKERNGRGSQISWKGVRKIPIARTKQHIHDGATPELSNTGERRKREERALEKGLSGGEEWGGDLFKKSLTSRSISGRKTA